MIDIEEESKYLHDESPLPGTFCKKERKLLYTVISMAHSHNELYLLQIVING